MSIQKRQLINNETGEAFVPIGHTEATYDANGNTVEQRLAEETQDRQAADIDLQRDVAELQDTTAKIGENKDDLAITDESGNAIVSFSDGHLKTKNLDSRNTTNLDDTNADFSITDENGKSIADFISGHIKTKHFDSSKAKKTIRILVIGNSYSYDAFCYVPRLIEEAADVNVIFGIVFRNGCTLQTHWEDYISIDAPYVFVSSNVYGNYGFYTSSRGAWEVNPIYPKISNIMASQPWDMVVLQQSYRESADYTTYHPYIDYIIDKISELAIKPVKFGFHLTPSLPEGVGGRSATDSDNEYFANANNAKAVLDDTIVEFILPCGTAAQNARHTSLDNVPTVNNVVGHLNYVDNEGHIDIHLDEGIPCLVEAYAAALKIMELAGCADKGIMGSKVRPTDAWIKEVNVITPQGSSAGVTDANCLLAQKCAVKAVQHPYEISFGTSPTTSTDLVMIRI